MTTTPDVPAAPAPAPADGEAGVVWADGVLAGRTMSSAVFLAGLIANAELETVGRPEKLPQDLFPHVPPEVAQEIFNRGVAVGLHAGRVSSSPRLYRDQMLRVQGLFEAAGFEAMARLVSRSRRLVAPHPADGETARDRSDGVTSRTSDTSWEAGDTCGRQQVG